MTSNEASKESEFLSALNASPESFVHKALKDEQMECSHRIVCHGRDVLVVLPTGLGKSAIYQLIIYMTKLLDSDWLRAVQFKCNTGAKSVKARLNGHDS